MEVIILSSSERIDFVAKRLEADKNDLQKEQSPEDQRTLEWNIKNSTCYFKFLTLERQIFRMIHAGTFDPVAEVFLKRYDEVCRDMLEILEESVSLNYLPEEKYRQSVDRIMKFRNVFNIYLQK